MDLEQATEIVDAYGVHIEHSMKKFMYVFGSAIPEFFLPFPVSTIKEAIGIVSEHYQKDGNVQAVTALSSSLSWLMFYKGNAESFAEAAKQFNDPKWRDELIPQLDGIQKEAAKGIGFQA